MKAGWCARGLTDPGLRATGANQPSTATPVPCALPDSDPQPLTVLPREPGRVPGGPGSRSWCRRSRRTGASRRANHRPPVANPGDLPCSLALAIKASVKPAYRSRHLPRGRPGCWEWRSDDTAEPDRPEGLSRTAARTRTDPTLGGQEPTPSTELSEENQRPAQPRPTRRADLNPTPLDTAGHLRGGPPVRRSDRPSTTSPGSDPSVAAVGPFA